MRYEKWSFGYWLLKQYIRFAYWLIHRRTVIIGREHIPSGKPLVFSPNHQNALSDPMAVLLNVPQQPVWLGRADIFGRSKVVDAILRFLKIIPVYRLRDGKENLDKNEQTFGDSIRVLENNSALALFPEAAHSFRNQMLVHKKAVPRIVFMAEEKCENSLDIQIIPTGIYYSHFWKLNRTVIVQFGDPIPVKEYLEAYARNSTHAVNALKSRIHDAMLPLVINIGSKTHYRDFERIREVYGRTFHKRTRSHSGVLNRFRSDQQLVARLDALEKRDPQAVAALVAGLTRFDDTIRLYKLRSWVVGDEKQTFLRLAGGKLLLLAGLPLFIYGFLTNAIPFFVIDRLVRRKVKDRSFWSTFFLVAGIILFPLIYLAELLLLSLVFSSGWVLAGALIAMPLAGKCAVGWYFLLRKTVGRGRWIWIRWFRPSVCHKIEQEHRELFSRLDELLHI